MREVVVSAATLAGLVGLACLYNNGSQRVRREADFEAVSDMEYEVLDLEVWGCLHIFLNKGPIEDPN